jgi:hypothetical protein
MTPKTGEGAVRMLLIAYCLDLAWKLAHWSELTKGSDWWMIAMALILRFAVMGSLLISVHTDEEGHLNHQQLLKFQIESLFALTIA